MRKKTEQLNRKTQGEIIFDIVNAIVLIIIASLIIYPLIFAISASLSDPKAVLNGEVFVLPKGLNMDSYKEVFKNQDLIVGFRNSIIITVVGTIINLIMTTIGAYPLSRKDFYGRNALMLIFSFTMFFGGGIIPTYLLIKNLGMINSWWALIIPAALSTYNMIIMRTYFQTSIPYELQEAALIDGCSNVGILFRIMLPLAGPIMAVLALYYGVGHWNSYFNGMIYINDRNLYPLQLFLREVLVMNQAQSMIETGAEEMARQAMRAEGIKYSVIVVSSLPMLIVYPFVQRFFVKGVMLGAIKG